MCDFPRFIEGCSLRICLSLVLFGWVTLSAMVAAEKREPSEKTDGEVSKSDKPPLGQITILVPEREFKTEGDNKALRVRFDDLDIARVLNTKKVSLDLPEKMPEWMKKLNGKRIRLRGFMHPSAGFKEDGISRFWFCRDLPYDLRMPVYHLVDTTLKTGTSTNYIENKHFDVEGVFRIKPEVSEGSDEVDRFYLIEDAEIVKK